jgi:hypothetical protein
MGSLRNLQLGRDTADRHLILDLRRRRGGFLAVVAHLGTVGGTLAAAWPGRGISCKRGDKRFDRLDDKGALPGRVSTSPREVSHLIASRIVFREAL